jgi:hypothetical protein
MLSKRLHGNEIKAMLEYRIIYDSIISRSSILRYRYCINIDGGGRIINDKLLIVEGFCLIEDIDFTFVKSDNKELVIDLHI